MKKAANSMLFSLITSFLFLNSCYAGTDQPKQNKEDQNIKTENMEKNKNLKYVIRYIIENSTGSEYEVLVKEYNKDRQYTQDKDASLVFSFDLVENKVIFFEGYFSAKPIKTTPAYEPVLISTFISNNQPRGSTTKEEYSFSESDYEIIHKWTIRYVDAE